MNKSSGFPEMFSSPRVNKIKQDRGPQDASKQKLESNMRNNPHEKLDTGEEDTHIQWSNLIFLPFHPVFQMLVLFSVIVKATMGPLQSVYPIIYCWDVMDKNFLLNCLKNFYWYGADTIYGMDTLLHIIHRQVTDKAMRREYMPKSAFLLLLDILSLIPFYRLSTTDICPPAQLWPNLMAYNEFLVFYRIWQYFNLISTHSYPKLILGFTIMFTLSINCLTSFWVLLTYEGLCANCKQPILDYDWRAYVKHKLNQSDIELSTYIYAASFVTTHGIRDVLDNSLPSTVVEFIMTCLFMLAGYMVENIIVVPKAFAESMLRLLRVCNKYPSIRKIIEETKRRNPSRKAYQHVETYYTIMWCRRSGIVHMPDIICEMPRYLRLEVKQNLLWPLFYHSPTLRKTSNALKRWLSECVQISYKLPGEKFYERSQCLSNLYYIKSGVVQLVSTDDGMTPILSVTSGTIFGDVNFLLPHRKRKVALRCLTYCEVYLLSRTDLLKALYRFSEDRKAIMSSFKDRIKHARSLFARKNQIRGLDRNEDEGIAWINRRWWEIFEAVSAWKKKVAERESQQLAITCELPSEESPYHCAKYLGQLVLCTDPQLQTKSMFVNEHFPWILSPYSVFGTIWRKIVVVTVFIALCMYPPHIIVENVPTWFRFIVFWTDIVYTADLCVSLSTAVSIRENESPTFASVMFERCKTFNFILDILSTIRIEEFMIAIGQPSLYYTAQCNRLIKIYVLFSSNYIKWDIRKNPMIDVCRKIIIIHFSFLIMTSFLVYEICNHYPDVTINYFFGETLCNSQIKTDCEPVNFLLGVTVAWTYELIFPENVPLKQIDIYIAIVSGYIAYIIYAYCKGRFLAYLYLKYRQATNYEYFVMNLKKFYQHYGINKDLLKRLERYLVCHYKYHKGMDVMHPALFQHEPFQIYWHVQGEIAEKIIGESRAFKYADPALVRELACATKYVILPKNATLYLFGYQCKYVTWVVQGYMKSESHNENSELATKHYEPGDQLSISSVFFAKAALRTYTTYSECEILYIRAQEFLDIIKRYPHEWQYLNTTKQQFELEIEEAFLKQATYHKEYQAGLRDKLLNTTKQSTAEYKQDKRSSPLEGHFWSEPESGFMQTWLLFRAITVFVSIANASLKGGVGALVIWPFQMIGSFCDCVAWIDITLKLFIAYYDSRGLLITDKKKCLRNYISKGFLMDVIGALPWFEVFRSLLSKTINSSNALLINTCCKFAHIYIVLAYFDYISDLPTVNSTLIMIVKWQVLNILIVMGASHYLMSNCVDFTFANDMLLNEVRLRNDCWIPAIFSLPEKLDSKSLHLIFVQSLNLAECGMMRMNHGGFVINRENYGLFLVLFVLGLLFWFVTCYTLTLLALASRENTLFQHGVNNLKTFLLNERVDRKIIEKAVAHFRYCWMSPNIIYRTKGINTEQMKNERIGVVFRQDLTYFFYKTTFAVLDTLLMGGEGLQRQLASVSSVQYFLPGHEIMREMDLMPNLYVVHRGRVILKRNGKKVITLTKGDIFGQLIGTRLRPVNISAAADNNVDLLQLAVKSFQENITDQVRKNIAKNHQSKYDFLATKSFFEENPYDTVAYILRGKKSVQLPWMKEPTEAHCRSWYARWLHLTWFCGPCITAFIVLILPWTALPTQHVRALYVILTLLDILHLLNFITEFYSTKLTVENKKCVKRIIGFRVFSHWGFYVDALSFMIPMLTLIDYDRRYQLAKLLRLKWFIDFEFNFCQGFKSKTAPRVLKAAIFLLLLHLFTCGWIYVACSDEEFPFPVPDFKTLNASIDYGEWIHPNDRRGGCARATKNIIKNGNKLLPAFVVPVYWAHDYILAMTFILLIHTHTNLDTVMAITINQVYYKMLVTFAMYLLDMWLLAIAISAVYTRLRNLYEYDYHVRNLTTFLKDSGLCPSLSKLLKEYTKQLWNKHKGVWLPQLAYQGPICLREDLFVALYMHHLDAPSTFRHLPYYFKRQLAARFERTVIFPGKCIVCEGDVSDITYFIHEGEVEKWYNDASGEGKMVSLLYTNGYFGCIPGLFVDSAFQFSYYTRTVSSYILAYAWHVVDLVYLRLQNWKDLLDGYPEIKKTLYESTRALKHEALKVAQFAKAENVGSDVRM